LFYILYNIFLKKVVKNLFVTA